MDYNEMASRCGIFQQAVDLSRCMTSLPREVQHCYRNSVKIH